MTGSLCFVVTTWPNKSEDLSKLRKYSFTKNYDNFSCATCSTQLFSRATRPGSDIEVVTGALDNVPGLIDYGRHIFVGDTKDGGCSLWFRSGSAGHAIKRWEEHPDQSRELPSSWPESAAAEPASLAPSDLTPLWCHCKGVQLQVKPGSDLSTTSQMSPKHPNVKDGKYITELDACDSCRLSLGSDIIYWAFVPVDQVLLHGVAFENITELQKAVEDESQGTGTLAVYSSSENVVRYHCSTCSASIFYSQKDQPKQLDIAVGVLDHYTGARAEGLLAWDYSQVGYAEDTRGGWREELVKRVLEEAKTLG